jgi:hypothetical protein
MKKTAAVAALALLVAACGDADGEATTTSGSPATTTTGVVSTTDGPTTTDPTLTTAGGPPETLPPVIAQVAFAFASGDDPRLLVRVSVGESPDGPWHPAGFSDDTPTLTGPSYWVRFDITNVDQLNAVLTDIDISGLEAGSPLGDDVCELGTPLPRDGEASCIVGEYPVQPGGNQVDFLVGGFGPRQGEPDRWFDPPIPTSLEYQDARNSFVLVFDTAEGLRVDGTADGSEVAIDLGGISGSVRLDCSGSPFEGDPGLTAYVIENFSTDGSREGGCAEIPTAELEFFPDGDSDDAYLYFGAEATTSGAEVTTTTGSG